MTFLPIVVRELRVAARRRSTYFFRFAAAVLGLLVLLWIMLLPEFRSPQMLGKALFSGLATVSFCYALLIGIFTTADSVSEEKRDGTLGLLFLTDLKGYDIVLGKLAATSMNAIYGLLALFPIMAIPLLAGGVTGMEFFRVLLSALNGIFLSLALGMTISALTRDERASMGLTLLLLLFLTGGVPLIGALLTDWAHKSNMNPIFLLFSPAYTSIMAFDASYRSAKALAVPPYYISLLGINVLAWVFLAIACVAIARVWQDKVAGAANSPRAQRWREWRFGQSPARLASRRLWLARNPFVWLAGRDQMKSLLVWLFLGISAVLWFWGLSVHKRNWTNEFVYISTGFILHTMLKFWLAGEACRQFGQDQRSGALELILSTPLSVRKIVQGQLIALLRQFAGPVLVILVVDYLFLRALRHSREWVLTWVAGMSAFVADLITLAWVGMWLGLRSRSLHRASAAAIVRVMFLPWMVFGLSMTALAIFVQSHSDWASEFSKWSSRIGEDRLLILTWLGLALLNDLAFALWARTKLLTHFRTVATHEYGSKK